MVGYVSFAWSRRRIPSAFSDRPAAATVTARMRPIVSLRMPRFRPTIFFAASVPWLVTGTLVEDELRIRRLPQFAFSGRPASFSPGSDSSMPAHGEVSKRVIPRSTDRSRCRATCGSAISRTIDSLSLAIAAGRSR